MLKRIIYRDPAAEGGGGAPVATPAQQTENIPMVREAPTIVTPTSYGGGSQYQDWQDPYDDPKLQAATQAQPPSNALVAGNQGASNGQPAPAADPLGPNTSTTATGEPGQAPAEKGAWSDEDRSYWEKKDPAYKDLPYHPAVVKMAQSTRELEAAHTKSQQYLGVVNQTIEDYKSVLQSGDAAEIAKMVEHFGGDVKFDARTPQDVIKEAQAGYTSIVQALQAVQHELPEDAIPVLNRVLGHLNAQVQAKVGEVENDQKLKAQVQAMAKAAGITPQIGNPNERYKAPAQANMTTLEREGNDPNFWKYYETIKGEFAPGGMYHAQGLTAGKAFGSSIDSARHFMNVAKGLWLQANMPSVISQHEQNWIKKQQGNGAIAPPPKGAGAVTAQQAIDPSLGKHERDMEEHMKRRAGAGV